MPSPRDNPSAFAAVPLHVDSPVRSAELQLGDNFSLWVAAMLWNDELLLVGIIHFPWRRAVNLLDDEQKLVVP